VHAANQSVVPAIIHGIHQRDSRQTYNVASDGRFIMMRATDDRSAADVRITLNWFADLRRPGAR
jgi:hypothetical protein